MTKNIDDGKHAIIFLFTDCWEVIFWRKKRGKMPFFVFIDPYRTRPGTGKTCSLHVTPPVEITPKILAKIASLNSSIAFGDLRLGGCLQARGLQAPARAQRPTRNTRIKRRNFRGSFWGHTRIKVFYHTSIPQTSEYGSSSEIWIKTCVRFSFVLTEDCRGVN